MHVGLIIYGSLDTLSGGYLYDRVFVEHLRGAGDTVEVVSLPSRTYARHLLDNFNRSLRQHLANKPFDVLVQDELNHPSLFALNSYLRKHVTYPIVSVVHHLRSSEQRPSWQNAAYRLIERRYLRSVHGFIFNSATTKGVVQGLIGNTAPSVIAYPGGDRLNRTLDEAAITRRSHVEGPLHIVFLGNLIPRKGLHVLLDALAQLPLEKWRLIAIGSLTADSAYTTHIRRQIARMGITDHVTLPGALSGEDLTALLMQGQVLAMPSSYEGFGIAYLEGMAVGLPAIASTAGAAHEIITHGVDGFLIPPGDSNQLAVHLHALMDDPARLALMSRAARARFDRHPTWQQSAAAIRSFLLSLSSNHSYLRSILNKNATP